MEITYKYNIVGCSDVELLKSYIERYTGLFYKIYNNTDLIKDKNFIEGLLSEFNVTKTIYDYCCKDVDTTRLSYQEILKEKEEKIEDINKTLKTYKECGRKLTDYEKFNKQKILNKKAELQRSLKKDICFGGKDLLRKITKTSQNKNRTSEQDVLLEKYKQQYTENRKRNIFLWGKALEGGNRCVDFNLKENYIILKFDKNNHIKLDLTKMKGNRREKDLEKINFMISENLIPITVRVCRDKVCLTFDNEEVNGYAFDIKEYNSQVKEHPLKDKKEIKTDLLIKQRDKKLKGKIVERIAAIDQNPGDIGFAIIDVDKETGDIEKVLFHRAYDLSEYVNNKSLTTKENNKHSYEIIKCYDDIFKYCEHYKVSTVGIEELTNITNDVEKTNSCFFNRITKNRWKRNLQVDIIKSRCDEKGILFNEVPPFYTSFIGNIQQEFCDCCAAATEIARRAYTKDIFTRNCLYPSIRNEDYQKLTYLIGHDVSNLKTWKALYNKAMAIGGQWRQKNPTKVGYLNKTNKSKVIICC